MELRHLRYFVAVAEAGSLTVAAETRLYTAQPSLSRQMRDLEKELGVPLMTRNARGIELTAAGKVFLDHARLVLMQVEAAEEATRLAGKPGKPTFAIGFLTGQEIEWMPEVMRILRDELPNIEVTVSSRYSPDLADDLNSGKLDAAFLRPEANAPNLVYRVVTKEPLIVVLPRDHRLSSRDVIDPQEIAGEKFVCVSRTAPVLRALIDSYLKECGIEVALEYEADNLAMGMSFITSTGSIGLLPAYAQNFLPQSVISRPLSGEVPTIDLVVGYNRTNESPILKLFLSRIDELIARVSSTHRPPGAVHRS
ncbi:MAG: transcriptional regulator [Chthonomonadaceae bacterium]|nr:transcriptional regulator [Chthonomonadaceae bacterium]